MCIFRVRLLPIFSGLRGASPNFLPATRLISDAACERTAQRRDRTHR